MCRDVGEVLQSHAQLGGAPATPEEMRVGGSEMIEEIFAPGKQIVGDLEVLEQSFGGQFDHAVGRAWPVADFARVVDSAQIGMNAAGTPGMERDRL